MTGISPLSSSEVNLELCRRTRMLVINGKFPDVSVRCASRSRESGVQVILSLEHINNWSIKLCSLADVVIVPLSLVERVRTCTSRREAVENFASFVHATDLVVTLADKGCLLFSKGMIRWFRGHKIRVCDTIGAGDAFTAALCYGILEGSSLSEACVLANAVAACACEGQEARSSIIPDASRIPDLLSQLRLQSSEEER